MNKRYFRANFQQGDVTYNHLVELMVLLNCTSPKMVFAEAVSVLYEREISYQLGKKSKNIGKIC